MFRQVEMKAIRARLDELLSAPYDPDFNLEKQSLNKKFQELLTQEETIWSQQSRALWLKAGDRNTTYFQRRASNRRQRNTIKGLHNSDGVWVVGAREIEDVVTSYYKTIFSSEGSNMLPYYFREGNHGYESRIVSSIF